VLLVGFVAVELELVLLLGFVAVELGLVLLVGFVVLPAELSKFGEAGLCSLVKVNDGREPVLFPVGDPLVVPGGTLNILPGGNVPVLLPGFVAFPPGARHPMQPQP